MALGRSERGLTPLTDVLSGIKRKADGEEPYHQYRRLKNRKQKELQREKELQKQLKEIQARKPTYDREMQMLLDQQSKDELVRWALANSVEGSEENDEEEENNGQPNASLGDE